MALVNFTNLDFDQIKVSIRDYLRANPNFTDYDFEGSNLSTLIDVLAYNTYISSYNANMVSNEVFIDSATLRENVVSLARNIGYVPRSRTAARANISFFVDTSGFTTNPLSITLKKGTVCSSATSFGNENYVFTIQDDITRPVINDIALFDNITVYEGTYLTENYTVDSNNPNQKFILNNSNIDTTTIRVDVRDRIDSSVIRKFNLSRSLFDVDGTSTVFYIQEIEDQRYELIFGDDVFGKKLDNGNYLEISYIVTSGNLANGISDFNFNGRLVDNNERVISSGISLVTTNSTSQSGQEIESVESIKKYAPRIYASKSRAVTASDYEAIVPMIYPETESISVFGGEDLNPPRYGKVYITIKPFNGPFLSNTIKDNIKRDLRKYSVAGIVPEILDLKYLYIEPTVVAYYNTNLAQSPSTLKTSIVNNITKYSESTELNRFGARFKYSKFLKIIDDTSSAITSNITKIIMRRDLTPVLNSFANYEICYGNEFYVLKSSGYNIKSSGFTVRGLSGTLYLGDTPNSDKKKGTIFFFRLDSAGNPIKVKDNVGSIDYVKGEIMLYPVNIISTSKNSGGQPIIQVSAIPSSNDLIGKQDLYLKLDINNSSVDMKIDEISSGSDVSGSIYSTTSSYSNGDLVRL